MANTRLELLMKKDEISYVQGSPLLLEAYALHKDTATGDCIAQIKWKNIDSRTVKAVMVELDTYDAFNSKLAPIQYQYDGLNAVSGSEFGGKTPIVIHDNNVSRFDVALKAVSFTDGGIWQNDADSIFEPLPKAQPQALPTELREQLVRDLTLQNYVAAVQYSMQNAFDLWQCGCGSWQKKGTPCLKCKVTESDLAAACDSATLQAHLKAYNAEQEHIRLEAEHKAEEERIKHEKQQAEDARKRAIKEKKARKICTLAGIALALVLVIGCAVKFWIIPQNKYSAAVKLRNAGQYDEAVTAFMEIDDYRDAADQILETKYQKAQSLYDAGNYVSAYATYIGISGYKDVDNLLAKDDNLIAEAKAEAARDAKFTVGNYVEFGAYSREDSDNNATAIEWIVLARDGKNALLLSRRGLDVQPYNEEDTSITWEECTLRAWLNDTFINKAFTEEEEATILTVNIDNSQSQCYSEWDTTGGNDTQDRIFLLSYAEANQYLGITGCVYVGEEEMAMTEEEYETYILQLEEDANGGYGWWWLRSPGCYQDCAAGIDADDSLDSKGIGYGFACVRPALWVNIESSIF